MTLESGYQRRIDAHFDRTASWWRSVYDEPTLWGHVYRERRRTALDCIDAVAPAAASVLEIGCGAGLLALDLAARGHSVHCIDTSAEMVNLAREQAAGAPAVTVAVGDAHELSFDDGRFDVVVALGVLPYLHSPHRALAGINRVTRPGGHVVVSSDNLYRLQHLVDPRLLPFLRRPKRALRQSRLGRRLLPAPGLEAHFYGLQEVRRMAQSAGFEVVEAHAIGFGPLTFLGRRVQREPSALRLHFLLQRTARRLPLLQGAAAQHLLLLRRPAER